MFWKYNSPSSAQIDAILKQEHVHLQELMDEEELLQECKAQNKKVIDYLTQPEILEELVTLLVTDPSPDRELQVRFKYANLASELLTCDVPSIVDKVASSSNLLQTLYKFLEKEKPLNPLLASFVSKVFGMLVQRRSEQNWYAYQFTCFQVLDFLKSQGDFVSVAVRHIGTSAVMDLLSKLICGVDDDDQEIKRGIHQWLNECQLIEQLIDKLTPDCDSEEHSSVDQLLTDIIATGQDTSNNGSDSQSNGSQSRLLTTLESKEMINKLMDTLLQEDRTESSVSHVINILLTLLSYKGSHKQSHLHHTNSLDTLHSDSLDSRNTVSGTILARLPDLQKILMQPTKLGTLMTSYGLEVERLGSTRLKVVNLITALMQTQDTFVHKQMASLHTLHLLFDLFFKFSLNNFLHTQISDCITCIMSEPLLNGVMKEKTAEIDGINNNPLKLENGGEEMKGGSGGEEEDVTDHSTKEEREVVVEQELKVATIEKMDKWEEPKKKIFCDEQVVEHPLLSQLLTECNIVQKILDCYSYEEANSSEKKLHNMIGYVGHMREMANALVQASHEGPCSDLIQTEMKKLPNDVITQWEEFALITLAEINLKNKIIPLQDFKEGDMDNIGDMRFVDDFKETDDNMGGSRGSGQLGGTGNSGLPREDGLECDMGKFEEMCAERNSEVLDFDEIWKGKERVFMFGEDHKKSEDDEHRHSSSDEEEGDIDDEFDALRMSTDEKMDVDFVSEGIGDLNLEMFSDTLRCYTEWGQWLHTQGHHTADRKEWADVFDKSGNALGGESGFNPWQNALASETADNNSWADFGASPFAPSSRDSFVHSDTQNGAGGVGANFPSFPSANACPANLLFSNPGGATQEPATHDDSGFQADFSNVLFSSNAGGGPGGNSSQGGIPEGEMELEFQADFGSVLPPSQGHEGYAKGGLNTGVPSDPLSAPSLGGAGAPLQDCCDPSKAGENVQQNVVVSKEDLTPTVSAGSVSQEQSAADDSRGNASSPVCNHSGADTPPLPSGGDEGNDSSKSEGGDSPDRTPYVTPPSLSPASSSSSEEEKEGKKEKEEKKEKCGGGGAPPSKEEAAASGFVAPEEEEENPCSEQEI